MSLLALSAIAALVGVAIIAFLVMRFVMKVVWKLAVTVFVVLLALGLGVAGYAYYGARGGHGTSPDAVAPFW